MTLQGIHQSSNMTLEDKTKLSDTNTSPNTTTSSLTPDPSCLPTIVQLSLTCPSTQTTDLLLQLYADRTFLTITQLDGKLGTLLYMTMEYSIIDNSKSFSIQTLLGRHDDSMLEVVGRIIYEKILQNYGEDNKPLLLGVAFKKDVSLDKCKDYFDTVFEKVLEMYGQASRILKSRNQ